MFTDDQVTPVRIEVLLEVLKEFSNGLERNEICELIQPTTISNGDQSIAKKTIKTAIDLELAEENGNKIFLNKSYNKQKTPKDNILKGFDQKVLCELDIEYYFALFYSYYLGLNKEVYKRTNFNRNDWATNFNEKVFKGRPQTNAFNESKHTGMDRWLKYVGLGWYDSGGQFQAYPYERVIRSLPSIFDSDLKLEGDDFMTRLGIVCPELDGGKIFMQANEYQNYKIANKQCSLGLSHALLDLHEDELIKLHCPRDSHGWNIGLAQPSNDDTIESDRITIIEYFGR